MARDEEGALRLLQRIDESLRLFPGDPAFTAAVRNLLPAALTTSSKSSTHGDGFSLCGKYVHAGQVREGATG